VIRENPKDRANARLAEDQISQQGARLGHVGLFVDLAAGCFSN